MSSSEAIADTYVDGIKTTTLTASDHASSSLTMRDWKPGYLMKQPLLQMKTHHNDMISLPQSVNTKSSHITPTVVSNTSDSIEVEEEFNIGAIVGFPQALKEFITEMEKDKTDMFTEIKREVESAATNEEALKALEEVNDRLMKKVDAMFAITADITVGEGEKAKQDMAKASMEGEAQFSAVNEMATTEIDKEDLYFSNSELIDSNTTMDVDQSIVLSTTESLLASKAQNLINHEAMKGWSPSNDQAEMAWMNPRTCIFCGDYQENELLGRLLPFSEGSVSHVNCIRWCYEVEEKEHVLYNVYEARERCSRQTCYYCHKRGATLNCKKWCRRSFHLRCAIACGSLLMDGSKTKELPDSACLSMFCPCHTELGLRKFGTNITLWTPSNPLSCLIFERDLDKKEMDEVCTILSQRRTDKAVKSGAVTILNIGNPILIDSWGFFNSDFIYPHHFRATRIYWSATKANTRTAYIFEILAITDTEHWDMTQMEYLQDMLEETNYDQDPQQQMNVYNSEYITGPIFRVAALDNLQRPIFARKIEHLYRYVMQRVEQCHALASSRLVHRHVYGMTPHQFFGLGLQFTRQAIEYIPESIASMISMNAEHRYSPSYKLPSEAEISHIQQAITSLKSATNTCVSVNGSSRADPFVQKVKMSGGTRLTRILTKVADHGEGDDAVVAATSNTANNGEEEEDCGMDLEKEGNLAEIEARVQKFKDMSKAYIKNPQSRLEVRKSPIHGWGLFAKINFEKDDVIVEYIGEKIRQVIADIREGIYENNGVGSCYLFR